MQIFPESKQRGAAIIPAKWKVISIWFHFLFVLSLVVFVGLVLVVEWKGLVTVTTGRNHSAFQIGNTWFESTEAFTITNEITESERGGDSIQPTAVGTMASTARFHLYHDEATTDRDPSSASEISARSFISPRQASIVNNAMDRELEAAEMPADFGERMEALFRDKSVDEMVRNFAVQHLERFAQERTVRGTWDVDSEEAEKVRAALEDAALEVDNSIGGTAMLALARLSEIDPHVDRRRLSFRSASLVSNPSTRLSTRIAAAQLCGLLRVRSALPALRSLSSDSSVPTPLRLAAQHAAEQIEGR